MDEIMNSANDSHLSAASRDSSIRSPLHSTPIKAHSERISRPSSGHRSEKLDPNSELQSPHGIASKPEEKEPVQSDNVKDALDLAAAARSQMQRKTYASVRKRTARRFAKTRDHAEKSDGGGGRSRSDGKLRAAENGGLDASLSEVPQNHSLTPVGGANQVILQRSLVEFENDTIQKQRQELQLLITELRDRDRELNEMVATHQRQLASWDQDRRRAIRLEEKCIRLEKELQSRTEEMHSLTAQLRIAESEVSNLRTALDSTHEQLAAVTEQHSQATLRLNEFQDQHRGFVRNIKELRDEIGEFETREQELLRVLSSKDRDLSESSTNITELSIRHKRSESLLAELRASEAELRRALAEANNRTAEACRETEHYRKQAHKFEQQCDNQHAEMQKLRQDLGTMKKEVLLTSEREKRKDQLLMFQKSKQERIDAEFISLRELYEKQQREMTLLQLNLESTKGLLAHQQKMRLSADRCEAQPPKSPANETFTLQPASFSTSSVELPGASDSSLLRRPVTPDMLPEKETASIHSFASSPNHQLERYTESIRENEPSLTSIPQAEGQHKVTSIPPGKVSSNSSSRAGRTGVNIAVGENLLINTTGSPKRVSATNGLENSVPLERQQQGDAESVIRKDSTSLASLIFSSVNSSFAQLEDEEVAEEKKDELVSLEQRPVSEHSIKSEHSQLMQNSAISEQFPRTVHSPRSERSCRSEHSIEVELSDRSKQSYKLEHSVKLEPYAGSEHSHRLERSHRSEHCQRSERSHRSDHSAKPEPYIGSEHSVRSAHSHQSENSTGLERYARSEQSHKSQHSEHSAASGPPATARSIAGSQQCRSGSSLSVSQGIPEQEIPLVSCLEIISGNSLTQALHRLSVSHVTDEVVKLMAEERQIDRAAVTPAVIDMNRRCYSALGVSRNDVMERVEISRRCISAASSMRSETSGDTTPDAMATPRGDKTPGGRTPSLQSSSSTINQVENLESSLHDGVPGSGNDSRSETCRHCD